MSGHASPHMPDPPAVMRLIGPWTNAPTNEHLAQVTLAKQRSAKIRNATNVAVFSGWSTTIFAFLTLLIGAVSFSSIGSLLGIGMAIVSLYELRGAGRIKRLDPLAPRQLAINQIRFGLLLFAYGAISLWMSLNNPSEVLTEINEDPQLREMAGSVDEIVKLIIFTVYGGVMLFAIIGPGLTAWYYITRRRYIEAYVRETPQWILDLQRAGMSL